MFVSVSDFFRNLSDCFVWLWGLLTAQPQGLHDLSAHVNGLVTVVSIVWAVVNVVPKFAADTVSDVRKACEQLEDDWEAAKEPVEDGDLLDSYENCQRQIAFIRERITGLPTFRAEMNFALAILTTTMMLKSFHSASVMGGREYGLTLALCVVLPILAAGMAWVAFRKLRKLYVNARALGRAVKSVSRELSVLNAG